MDKNKFYFFNKRLTGGKTFTAGLILFLTMSTIKENTLCGIIYTMNFEL